MWADAFAVCAKDLRIEMRSKVAIGQILPFALTVLLLFAFALDPDRGILTRASAGLFWIAVLLSSMLTVQRSFAIENNANARDALRLSGVDAASIFFGKAIAVAVQLFALEIVLAAGVVILYSVPLHGAFVLLVTCILATLGIAACGVTYGVLAASERAKETLLPLLFLPVVAPVLLGAARATESALGTDVTDAQTWIGVLSAFAVIYIAVGSAAFGPLLEDS